MNTWLDALNHALAAALPAVFPGFGESDASGGAFTVREVRLEPDGFRLVAQPRGAKADGGWVLRGRIESEHAGRQRVVIMIESAPERLPEVLAPFRALLETARFTLDLDFRSEVFRA